MRRINLVRLVWAGLGAVALLSSDAVARAERPPNLLFILPDQFRQTAMAFWQEANFKGALRTASDPVVTPTLDRLAAESIVFTQATSTCPVCSPCRAMLMSGMYPWQNGVVNNCREHRTDGLRHDIQCFTDVLARAGYDTCYVGKTHWERNEPLFDEQGNYVGKATPPGGHYMNSYDTYIPPGKGRHEIRYWFQSVKDVHKDPRVYSSDPARIGGRMDGEPYRPKIYSPLLEADVLVDYLKNTSGQRDTNKPFCVFWAPNPPHPPYASEKDCDQTAYRKYYKGMSPKELLVRKNVPAGELTGQAAKSAPFYFANVTGDDKQIGRVLEALQESGEASNTIVVFTSDHGEMMGSHGKMGKLVIYEEAFRVPFMIRFPGRIKPRLEDLMISSVDIMPTLLGLMGLNDRMPESVKGKDYSEGLLTDKWSTRAKPKSALFLGYNSTVKGVRTDRYTFQIDEQGRQLLFDNEADPYQMNPLVLKNLPKADAEFLLSELGKWLKESNDPWYRTRKFSGIIRYPE